MPVSLRTGQRAALGLLLAAAVAGQEPPHLLPGVETSRVVLEARVTDGNGRPLPGLEPADFRLEVDGRKAPLESAVWVAESPSVARALPLTDAPATAPSLGRLVVLLFQKDFEGSRLRGLLRAIRQAKDLVAPFSPRDRVAVLTYDSHLRLHLDFTADFDAVRRILDESVLLFGYGLGELRGGTVVLDRDYDEARAALDRARAAVLSGHYVLIFERPDGPRSEHRVRLALAGRCGSVLTRTRYVD